jgi:hypothetical protein
MRPDGQTYLGVPYHHRRLVTEVFGSDGYPAIAPPWATLNAINLNPGE